MKREPYFSWGKEEQTRLMGATHDEVVMYLTVLKPLAEFRTGVVGTFAKRPLSLARLGDLMGRPAAQGRQAVTYDGTEARRILERLAARGLVADIAHVGGALVLRLPLSPIGASAKAAKLSGTPEASALASPSVNELPEDFTEPAPVLTTTDQSRREIHTGSRRADEARSPIPEEPEDGADPTPAQAENREPWYFRRENEYTGGGVVL